MTDSEPPIPEFIGEYRIDGRLGAGGMGEVFRAWDPDLERPVAIKLIRSDTTKSAAALERFRREALVIAQLDHPSIVRIHHIEKWQGHPCLVMELVEGESLAKALTRGPLPLASAVSLLEQIASGLAAAHEQGIVHRDLKSANVMLATKGRAKILDFGIAKRLLGQDEPLSVTGAIVGTLHTMSPEQAAGRPVDGRADLFALGVLAYEMSTGRSPFRADTATETLAKVISHYPQPLVEVVPSVPQPLSDLVDRLLAKDPANRPASAQEVVDWLDAWQARTRQPEAAGSEAAATIPMPGMPGPDDIPTQVAGQPSDPDKTRAPASAPSAEIVDVAPPSAAGGRKAPAIGTLVGILLALAGFFWFSTRTPAPLTVAVVGLAPEDPASASAWQTTALEEALILSLRDHPSLRALDGASMGHVRRALDYPGSLDAEDLPALREAVSADLADIVVTGVWSRAGDAWNLQLQVGSPASAETRQLDASGPAPLEAARAAIEPMVRALGIRRADPVQNARFSALLPTEPEVLRPYAEGLTAQRSGDLISARAHFEKGLALDPESAELNRAYADASGALGFESDAQRTAEVVLREARRLPPGAAEILGAAGYALSEDLERAIAVYEKLFTDYPDEIAFGIEVARLRMLSDDGRAALETIEALRPEVRGSYAGRLDLVEARVRNDAGEFERAKELARRSATIGAELGLLSLEAEGKLGEGVALENLRDIEGANRAIERAFLVFQKTGNLRRGVAALINRASLLHYGQGKSEEALSHLRDYRELFARRGDPQSVKVAETNMGAILADLGRLDEAKAILEPAVAYFQEHYGASIELGSALLNLGVAHHYGGDLPQARLAYERAEPIFLGFGDRPNLANTRNNLGEIQQAQGNLEQAEAAYRGVLLIERDAGRPSDVSYALNRLGDLALLRDEIEGARALFTEALAVVEELEDTPQRGEAQMGLARVELAESNAGAAKDLASTARQLFLDSEDPITAHRAEILEARTLLQRMDPELDRARVLYDNVDFRASQIEDRQLRFELELLAARIAIAEIGSQGRPAAEDPGWQEIRGRLEASIAANAAAGLVLDACETRLVLGELEMALGELEMGRERLRRALEEARQGGWIRYAQQATRLLE